MEENKNFEGSKGFPETGNENVGPSHEQQLGKGVEKLNSGLANLDSLKQEVGGDQEIKNTVEKMSPEEKQRIINRIKGTIQEKMGDSKIWAKPAGVIILAVVLEYIGFRDLDATTPGGSPEWFNDSAVVFMLAQTILALGMLSAAAKEALSTIGDRIKFWKANKQEVVA